ncbi:serine/threonine protein kinase [Rothia dentocariosa]|uniref:serine/threonine protein kinase n=1 Tax=Rothia dentocariosa TaxID=2047 RepID=UPI003A86B7EE
MTGENLSQQIPVGTVLGGRYEITAQIIITAESDMILEGKDQILNRKVSVVVASPVRSHLLEKNSRALAVNSRYNIQILDMGIAPEGNKYLVTSYSRPDVLLDTLLTDNPSVSPDGNPDEALGAEIFGDSLTGAAPQTYENIPMVGSETSAISAVKAWEVSQIPSMNVAPMVSGPNDDGVYEDDEDEGTNRGTWAIAFAAVLLLVIVAGGVLTTLTGLGSNHASNPVKGKNASASTSATAGSTESEEASPSASPSASNAPVKVTSVSRLVPSNPNFMADMDSGLPALTDGNPSSTWSSYGFGSPAFGGVVKEFGLAAKLESPTVVSKLTIQQTGGSGGSFTVYTNNQASMSGATEVGKGSFSGQDVTVELNKDKQSADKGGYIIIVFDEAPKLSQPIAGYSYGLRIGEIKAE